MEQEFLSKENIAKTESFISKAYDFLLTKALVVLTLVSGVVSFLASLYSFSALFEKNSRNMFASMGKALLSPVVLLSAMVGVILGAIVLFLVPKEKQGNLLLAKLGFMLSCFAIGLAYLQMIIMAL